jgi:hypothetical protein
MYTDDKQLETVGKLLSNPNDHSQKEFARSNLDYENLSDRFKLKTRNFGRQFAHLYAERLQTMRSSITNAAKKKWGGFSHFSFSAFQPGPLHAMHVY